MWWLIRRRCGGFVDRRCGGSLVARQTSEPEVPCSNPLSPIIILGRGRIIVQYCKILRDEEDSPPEAANKHVKEKNPVDGLFLFLVYKSGLHCKKK